MSRFLKSLIPLCVLLVPALALSHGDDKPLFVAESGADNGRCKDSENPCRTLGYALQMAGKGGKVRLTAGSFEVSSAEDLFMLVSGTVDIEGGYLNDGKFTASSSRETVLTGVPPEFRELLSAKGIQVIVDSKGNNAERSAEAQKLIAMNSQLQAGVASAPCAGGSVGGLPCSSVDLLSHISFGQISATPAASADVWGYVDLNTHREYAIVGFYNGTGIFDVTDPSNPVEIEYLFGPGTTWRDIKVYQKYDPAQRRWNAYAYVTADNSSEGMFVIDLTGLPHYVERSSYVSTFSRAHNVYASNTDYGTGVSLTGDIPTLIVAGSNAGGGRFQTYGLDNPVAPTFIGDTNSAGYMHDASSMIVTDSRKDTQCINGGDYCEVLFDFNENEIELWDITNSASPAFLGDTSYSNASYVHSGWWSEDKQYLFGHDELDERNASLLTTLRVFSLADLRNPTLAGTWTGSTAAIDHNGFVRGNRYYMSNYSQGLTVLDITNPTVPTIAGYLDTYPISQSASFVGAWGAYPYFHSGTIAISDISSGVYLAKDNTRNVVQGSFIFDAISSGVTEGNQVGITVNRVNGSVGAVSVDYELIGATAATSDYSTSPGPLTWAAGDAAPKTILINATVDGSAEDAEHVLVRLVAPQGGATLGDANTTHLFISDVAANPVVEFLSTSIDVAERGANRAIVAATRKGSAIGSVSMNVSMTDGDATPVADFTGNTSATVVWADGDATPKLMEFVMVDDGTTESTEYIKLSINSVNGGVAGSRDSVSINIGDGNGLNLPPIAVAGNDQSPTEDTSVTLDGSQSSDPNSDLVSYQWTQTLGEMVALSSPTEAITTFTAPSVASDTMLQFRLTVSDPFGRSDSATVTVTVRDSASVPPTNNSGGGSAYALLLLLASIALLSRALFIPSRYSITNAPN